MNTLRTETFRTIFAILTGLILFTNGTFAKTNQKENSSTNNVNKTFAKPARNLTGLQAHSVGVGLGQTFLKGDFASNGEDAITFDVYHNYTASYSFDLLTNIHISKHKFGTNETVVPGAAVAIKSKIFQYDNFAPFIHAGLGFYRPYVKDALGRSEAKTKFGANFGTGVELKLNNRMTVGIIGHYHNPFDTKQFGRPEIDGSYFKLLITALYTFEGV